MSVILRSRRWRFIHEAPFEFHVGVWSSMRAISLRLGWWALIYDRRP